MISRIFSLRTVLLWGGVGLFLFVQPARAGLISATNSTPGTFDGEIANRAVTFSGFEAGFASGVITDLNVTISYVKAPSVDRPFFEEIHFALIAPNGDTIELIAANSFNQGAIGSQFNGVQTFDQSAPTVVNANPDQPTAGTFRPTGGPLGSLQTLNAFNGNSAMGVWTLFIEDTVLGDPLAFNSFTLDITTRDFSVPEPMSLLLMGLGLAGLALRSKSRQ